MELIASHFGRLLKVDEYITSLSLSKFARICIEIDLNLPLKQGIWIGDDDHKVFVIILYKKLPTFYYICGMVGHGSNSCSRRSVEVRHEPSVALSFDRNVQLGTEERMMQDPSHKGLEAEKFSIEPYPSPKKDLIIDPQTDLINSDYGPWMLVSWRRR